LQKPLDQLPVSKDIIRLQKKIQVFHDGPLMEDMNLKNLIFTLGETLQKESYVQNKEKLTSNVLTEERKLTEYLLLTYKEGIVNHILKTCCQNIMVQINLLLREKLFSKNIFFQGINFILNLDVNGSWRIEIYLEPDLRYITKHIKTESCYKKEEGLFFN
jgi:hypothetical protein